MISLAPEVLTINTMMGLIVEHLQCAEGLGILDARNPESGWDQSTFFDHDIADHLAALAEEVVKVFAKANQFFYNTTKLQSAIGVALVEAYGNGFISK